MKLRVLIADDEPLALERLRQLLAAESEVEIVAECADGREFVEAVPRYAPDVAFLDIQMPGVDGFEALDALGPDWKPIVIYLTAHAQHAVRAFETRAIDYLLKPVSRARLKEALQRVQERLSGPGAMGRRLAVKDGDRVSFVVIGDIDWIESAGNYALLHAGGRTHILRQTMASLEEALPENFFLRVSRGAIVNIGRVTALKSTESVIVLADGITVPVTRPVREVERRLRDG
jgi:two-component system, LytTR family, response regulator